jgi:NADH-quinone oxidoreductase subunit N
LYVIVNLGIFAILIYFSKKDEECETTDDLSGLGYKYPVMAIAMGIFMFSLAGIPPTGGFMGKLYLFAAAVKSGYLWLVVIAVIASGVSVYYYLRVMMAMFKKDGTDRGIIKSPIVALVAVITALAALYLGVLPGYFMELARSCASALF